MTNADEGLLEMQRVLRTKLAQRGVLKKLKAQIRAEIFAAMMNSSSNKDDVDERRNENFLVNELLREYLSFNGYQQTLSVFTAEANINKKRPFDADFVAQEVGLGDEDGVDTETRKLPLIYQMIQSLKTKRFEEKLRLDENDQEDDIDEESYVDDLPRIRMLNSVPPAGSESPTKSSMRSRPSTGSPFGASRPPFR